MHQLVTEFRESSRSMPAVHAVPGLAVSGPVERGKSAKAFRGAFRCHFRAPALSHVRKRQRTSFDTAAVADGQLTRWLEIPPDRLLISEDGQEGLKATRRISRGQAILSIPASKWITPDTVARSDWREYLSSLPESIDSPISWDDTELEELLTGTRLLDSVLGYRNVFESKFKELEETLFEGNRDVFPEETFTRENFLRTVTVMRARVHPPLDNERIALVPIADQVSHQRGRGALWKLNSGGFGQGEKALTLEAERDFETGEVLTMDFGPEKLDGDILLNYGVMDDLVSRGGFALNLELPESDEFYDDKADILDISGFAESHEFVLARDREPSAELLAFLRLINLSGPDAFLLESLFRNDAWGFLLKPVSLENETAVFTSMLEGCRGALEDYGKNISQAKAALKASDPGSRTEKAMRVSVGEQEALHSTLQFFEERIGKLESLEYYQERRLKGLGLLDEDGSSTFDSFFKDGIA